MTGDRQKLALKHLVNRLFERCENAGFFRKLPGIERDTRREYPELAVLEENHKLIRDECLPLLRERERLVPLERLGGSYTAGGVHAIRWTTLVLKMGAFIEENCRLCPRTAALLRGLPGLHTAFFSILDPHQHIAPHRGYYKGFVRYHLGVEIPGNNERGECYLRVDSEPEANRVRFDLPRNAHRRPDRIEGETYHWRNGEAMIFDDTFVHEAGNDSDQPRVVLFVDVLRKMPWPLHAFNRFCLFVAGLDGSLRRIRKEAVAQP